MTFVSQYLQDDFALEAVLKFLFGLKSFVGVKCSILKIL